MWWLAKARAGRPARSRSVAQGASAVLSLVLIIAVAYAAHSLGIFALPLVVLAFLPFGVAARWFLVANRDSRQRRALDGRTAKANRWARFAVPLMAIIAAAAALLGVVAGTLVGRN
jgi:hypothetical protein